MSVLDSIHVCLALSSLHSVISSQVVFLCTLEAFIGLLYAGMCAAILFGKVNRVQCHAPVEFANPVCLLYEDVESFVHSYRGGEDDSDEDVFAIEEDEVITNHPRSSSVIGESVRTVTCPVLKFQVVNEVSLFVSVSLYCT